MVDRKNLESCLNEAWYKRGSISDAADIVRQAQRQGYEFSGKAEATANRAMGASRLKQEGVTLPPRVPHAAYLPEPGRVFYAVHSTPVFNSNGYSTRTRGVAEGMTSAGLDVVVVARSGYPWDSATDMQKPKARRVEKTVNNIQYVHIPAGDLNQLPLDRYVEICADAFVREARRLRPSAIISASNHRTALAALIAARRLGIPFLYEVRGLWEITETVAKPLFRGTERFEQEKALETFVANEADKILAITNQVADELRERGVDGAKISVVPNAVDTDRFVPIPKDTGYAKKIKIDPDLPTIGFAGSIVGYEGLDTLLDASKVLDDRGVRHQVVIAGSGSAEAELKKQATDGAVRNVHFVGRLPQNEMPRLLSVFDIVACPRKRFEITELVSPLKPLEAFASGCATVLSNVAPNVDLAGTNQDRALLFPAGDAIALADKLESLLNDDDLRRAISRGGRLWTIRNRRWSNIGLVIVESLRDAVGTHQAASEPSNRLNETKIGLIADEFTTQSLKGSVQVVPLSRERWKNQLAENELAAIFVESAWEGNNGEWWRGVGFYSQAESHDLYTMLDAARELGIPTIFWNKEDPVHFDRFAPTAARFDHVFTTDANKITDYRAIPGNVIKTVSSLPFWAQPAIHNPLALSQKGFHETVAHAGSFYGDRYPARSKDLLKLLSLAEEFGLEIYDRQAGNPDSPYKFPNSFTPFVVGGLPYSEVVDSYKNHIAHLNVNSVTDSPTMFSRRVVEIPASGGVVLSSPSRGVEESLGPTIASSGDEETCASMLYAWSSSEVARKNEIWRQMRTVFRAHTATSALLLLLRTAGLAVSEPNRASYALRVSDLTSDVVADIKRQSYWPGELIIDGPVDERIAEELHGIILVGESTADADYIAEYRRGLNRTYYEDLLLGSQFGTWTRIGTGYVGEHFICTEVEEPDREILVSNRERVARKSLMFELPRTDVRVADDVESHVPRSIDPGTRVLIAGHDLKFANAFIGELKSSGARVLIDKWENHTQHDEKRSLELLESADVVFCEWGLGNIRWYSRNIRPGQRLVVRVHLQELFRPYLSQTVHKNVDAYVFVGKLIRDAAVISHGVPRNKTITIGNSVSVDSLARPKDSDARYTLGFVGSVPQRKRLDLALDVLEALRAVDERYRLRVKGKTWKEFPWLKNRAEEIEYYEQLDERIARINSESPGTVILDSFGDDMAEWYSKVGIVLSTSDFESFHLTIADGAASGALPAVLAWAGSDFIYPANWLIASPDLLVDRILNWDGDGSAFQDYVRLKFGADSVTTQLCQTLVDGR